METGFIVLGVVLIPIVIVFTIVRLIGGKEGFSPELVESKKDHVKPPRKSSEHINTPGCDVVDSSVHVSGCDGISC